MQQMSSKVQQQANDPTPQEVSEYILEDAQVDSGKVQSPYQKEERWLIIEKVAGQLEQNRGERLKYAKKTFTLTC